jgi:MYXO-CTERM domain-containing protein
MKKITFTLATIMSLAGLSQIPAQAAELLVNGGFETAFSGWVRVDQVGSEGTFLIQNGTLSPVNGLTVVAPPAGSSAAMTDSQGPGSHVLYQDFLVPALVPTATVSFSLFLNNLAPSFFAPATLDFSTPTLNQQFRADIITTTADPFSVLAADILQNLYQTASADPLTSGYTAVTRDITALLTANAGQTLRLRFASVDNVNVMNTGLDQVSVSTNPIPEPGTWLLAATALAGLAGIRRRRVAYNLCIRASAHAERK